MLPPRELDADLLVPDVRRHPGRIARERIAETAPARLVVLDHVAAREDGGELGRHLAFGVTGVQHVAGAAGGTAPLKPVGQEFHPIGPQLESRLVVQERIAAPKPQPTPPLSRPAAVRDEAVLLDADRMLGFEHLDRRVRHVLRRVGDGFHAVLVRAPAPGARDHVDDHERFVIRVEPADRQHGVAALTRRGHALGQRLRQRAEHDVEHPVPGEGARRARARQARVEDGALGGDDVDTAKHAGVVRHVLAQHRSHREITARLRERQRRVQRGFHLGRRARPVAREVAVVVDRERDRQRHRVVAESVAVEMIGEPVRPLRPARDLRARDALGVVEELARVRAHGLAPVPREQPPHFSLADLARRVLGPDVAEHPVRDPHVLLDDAEHGLARHPALVELHRRDAQPLLVHLGRVAGIRAGHAAAHVGLMPDHDGEGFQLVVDEDRQEQEDVRDVHPAVVRIVHHDDVAGVEIARELAQHALHRVGHRAEMLGDGPGLGDEQTVGVAQGRRVVHDVLDDLGARGADDGIGHLVHDGVEGALDDRERDRIDLHDGRLVSVRLPKASRAIVASGGTAIVES